MNRTGPVPIGLGVAVIVGVIDQISKWWIVEDVMRPPHVIEVTPFFNIVLAWNRGVSFGMFNEGSPGNVWLLSGIALGIVVVLMVWLWRSQCRLLASAIGLIIGGAMGNVIDRMNYGAVADFLDFHVAGFHWPAFNVADSAIFVGAVVLVLDSLFGWSEKNKMNGQ
ncbi:MAG: signal peptidase II [Rhodospirillaceae bacterium]|jgi:signal peptidase II|nr:signal peptidase II [Rhodospirillaceae bacterium]MBT4220131.1 signal peptidase II [Rhodospirillaceae bacterium]MBT4463938.1 signal peptidase II [Rhodospirillaceae bacterium]MBT5013458.1 signal peptidase II [Rhodospirillaceae bacterium]MBT5307706.1 signal peptidase II [Rhodospirillaceae bacterium]